ncbi:hypothetical protein ACLFMI_20995 [Pseudonocardia nantongensis]|uniref:hypothetical protein n=1 Tax=Pseudonocardia nantongensis TaxID=1181885 RepID=UPI00397A98D9
MVRIRPGVSGLPLPCRDPGASALVLGGIGALLVVAATVLTVTTRFTVSGLVLASTGVVFALAGLALGTTGAMRGYPRASRLAISGAGLAVVGLAGGLVWIAAFILTTITGPPVDPGFAPVGPVTSPACATGTCPGSP